MKILDFVINDYFAPQFNEVRKYNDVKNLPVFTKTPKNYFGNYFLKVLYEGENLFELRSRLID